MLILFPIFFLLDSQIIRIFFIFALVHLSHIVDEFISLLAIELVLLFDCGARIVMLSVDLFNC